MAPKKFLGLLSSKKNARPTKEAAPSKSSIVQKEAPTASRRKRLEQIRQLSEALNESESSSHQSTSEESDEEVEVAAPCLEEDVGEQRNEDNGPFPGGPTDLSVLISYKHHVAAALWGNPKHRGDLKCVNHGRSIGSWNMTCHPQQNQIYEIINQSRLAPLMTCSYNHANKSLISAFVERWHPETNTFHLPFGEMSITLDDVRILIDIPVTGKPVMAKSMNYNEAVKLVCDMLGVEEEDVSPEFKSAKSFMVSFRWLKTKFGSKRPSNEYPDVIHTARAYLFYLLGSTLFADRSGTRVHVSLLQLLEDVDAIGSYAWGGAALAFLYHHLGCASRSGATQVAGYLTLLEGWIYDHLPCQFAHFNMDYNLSMPRVQKWKPSVEMGLDQYHINWWRQLIDRLRPNEVVWDPYEENRRGNPVPDLAFYYGLINYMDMVEPYHPDRFLRQLGHVQTIPDSPIPPLKAKRLGNGKYAVKHHFVPYLWKRWNKGVLGENVRGERVKFPHDCVPGYLEWFTLISHPIIYHDDDTAASTESRDHFDSEAVQRNRHAMDIATSWRSTVDSTYTCDCVSGHEHCAYSGAVQCVDSVIAALSGLNVQHQFSRTSTTMSDVRTTPSGPANVEGNVGSSVRRGSKRRNVASRRA